MSTIRIRDKTYDLLKKYVDQKQFRDNLIKSFDDRILDMVGYRVKMFSFRPILKFIDKYVSDLNYSSGITHLELRKITLEYLKIFSFINGYRTLNKGLYHLIESEMTEITIQQLREEIEQREQKLSRLNKNLQVSEGGY